jgi:hypothetical protein
MLIHTVSGKLAILKYYTYSWVYTVTRQFTLLERCNIMKILREFLRITTHFRRINDPYVASVRRSFPSVFLYSAVYNHPKILTKIVSKTLNKKWQNPIWTPSTACLPYIEVKSGWLAKKHVYKANDSWKVKKKKKRFQQWRNSRSPVGRSVSRMSDPGFIRETEARLRVVLSGRQLWKVRSWRRSDRLIRSDRFQLSEGVQSSRLRVRVISEVKWSEEEENSSPCEDFTCE